MISLANVTRSFRDALGMLAGIAMMHRSSKSDYWVDDEAHQALRSGDYQSAYRLGCGYYTQDVTGGETHAKPNTPPSTASTHKGALLEYTRECSHILGITVRVARAGAEELRGMISEGIRDRAKEILHRWG